MYNFFIMFFFGKNLQTKHKVALCLAALGILANFWVCTTMGTFPMIEYLANGSIKFNITKITLSFGIFVKILIIVFFRKF